MMGKYTKQEAISIVTSCAQKYHMELDGKTLLFLCQNKHKQLSTFEFSFDGNNFLHLTGLKVSRRIFTKDVAVNQQASLDVISANEFYQKCLSKKLSPNDFEFADDGTTFLKLDVLPYIVSKNLSANAVADYNSRQPKLHTEKLAGSMKACIGFVADEKSGHYVPNTVLKEDIRDISTNSVRVLAVYRKQRNDAFYAELTYKAKKVDWTSVTLPENLNYIVLPEE